MNSSTDQGTDAVEHILVIRFSSLGDILLTAPALSALRNRFPESHIDLLVADEFRDAAKMIPGPNRILGFNRSRGFSELLRLRGKLSRCYHVVVDLQNNFRSSFLRTCLFPTLWVKARRYRIRRWLLIHFKWNLYGEIRPVPVRYLDAVEMLGCHNDGRGLELSLDESTTLRATRIIESWKQDSKPFAVLSPGAKHFTKRWPAERWIELGRMLSESGKFVVVLGDSSEAELVSGIAKQIPKAVTVIAEPIEQVAALLRQAEFAVTNDSGIMHLAAGVGTPLVSLFGSTVRQFGFIPYSENAILVEHELPCRPCTAFGRASCPKRHFRCMMDTTAEWVFAKIQELIQTRNQPTT
ncbi:glycosyltransferase family 9 protein [bacterium]|nr:glycosyltransferase family 9 protein [bacterium]